MIKPRMNIFQRLKVLRNIKLQLAGNIYISDFYKRNMHWVSKHTSMNAPFNIRTLFDNKNTCDGYTNIYALNSKYDIMQIVLAYNQTHSKLFVLDNRIDNDLLEIAIATVEAKVGIIRLINRNYLK